uniref:Transposase n=1 Tax=Steinernema glaseri TaxID=37863 RepID=A0A1I8A4M6_9BILA
MPGPLQRRGHSHVGYCGIKAELMGMGKYHRSNQGNRFIWNHSRFIASYPLSGIGKPILCRYTYQKQKRSNTYV